MLLVDDEESVRSFLRRALEKAGYEVEEAEEGGEALKVLGRGVVDLVITDLARWKDWSVRDQLFSMYGQEEYNIPSIKRAIVRYYLVCSKDVPKEEGKEPGEHVAAAKSFLALLREKDPKTVSDAERFFIAP